MTVAKLINELSNYPLDALVFWQGCDIIVVYEQEDNIFIHECTDDIFIGDNAPSEDYEIAVPKGSVMLE